MFLAGLLLGVAGIILAAFPAAAVGALLLSGACIGLGFALMTGAVVKRVNGNGKDRQRGEA